MLLQSPTVLMRCAEVPAHLQKVVALDLQSGIASTTHLDEHGQIIDRKLLDDAAIRIRASYLPLLINHDPDRLIGAVLNARVTQLPDGEYALIVVSGIYESNQDAESFAPGLANTVYQDFESQLDAAEQEARTSDLPRHADVQPTQEGFEGLRERLSLYLSSTQVLPDGSLLLTKRQVVKLGDLKIEVYRDHEPPHFHVKSVQRGFDARFDIETLEYISNKRSGISPGDIRAVKRYFLDHPDDLDKLRNEYQRMNTG
jgi:hypothetical protein